MRTPSEVPRRAPRTSRRFRIGVIVAVVVLILLISTARGLAGFYTTYLWFREVHFTSVFRGVLVTKILLAIVFSALFFAAMLASLTVADRFAPLELDETVHDELVERYRASVYPHGRWLRIGVALVFALFGGVGVNAQWNNWDLFRYGRNFDLGSAAASVDPLFHKNIGFYVFKLPFIDFLLGWTFSGIVVIILVTAVAAYLNGGIRFQGARPRVTGAVKTHLSVLLGLLALDQAFGYYFQRFGLVLSTAHVVDGATNTSVHANLPADNLLIVIAVVAAILFLVNTRVRGWTLPVVAVIVWGVVWVVAGNIYPALYQALRVNPSELTREAPYIARNIAATRTAYGLDNVKVVPGFDAASTISAGDIQGGSPQAVSDRETIGNVSLLDPNYVVNTFQQLQALRPFYSINSLSVGRYDLNGQLTETLTGVRELNDQVPSGFVTAHLQYTHGYGAAVSPANQGGVDADGYPNFTVQNTPPAGPSGNPPSEPPLSDRGAQVYFGVGSSTSGFVIADSKQPELDYQAPSGAEVTSHYAGPQIGGVPVGNLLRRLAFAINFGNLDILLSGQVTDSSRVIYNRNVLQRVQLAAPFLRFDANPYAAIVDGQIYWIVDGYTTTANYPYSQLADTSRVPASSGLSGRFNYVRNSVKVVVNAYTGKMDFFVVDQSDPIIQAYERAFPGLFIKVSRANSLIPGITSQFRYPEDLFTVQTNMYGRYHLTNVSQFYSQANAWSISPNGTTGAPGSSNTQLQVTGNVVTSQVKPFPPEYEVAAQPGSTQQGFLLLQPFVPVGSSGSRQNLTGVMFAASPQNGTDGALTLYETPPGTATKGPSIISSAIASNPNISSELSLLDQHGSSVQLGQVEVVPVANTLMYVQPVYVESSNNQIPQLRNVIVVYNNQAYQSKNASIDAALCSIGQPFEQYCTTSAAERPTITVHSSSSSASSSSTTSTSSTSTTTTLPSVPASASVRQLLADAQSAFDAANTALQSGNLAAYQADIKQAEAYVARARAEASG
jgi:uncharacterized membrane protein (UPF0182 family)